MTSLTSSNIAPGAPAETGANTPQRSKHRAGRQPSQRATSKRKVDPIYHLMLTPTLILFTLAITIPAIIGFLYSFTNSIGIGDWKIIGITNYVEAFRDPAIRESYVFTIIFAFVTVITVNAIAFLLAVGLTSKIRFKAGLRTIFVIPMVISGIVIAFVFRFIFNTTLTSFGNAANISWLRESFLSDPLLAALALVIVTAWQAIPGTLLIYIAGILSIPSDVYEAAAIDGANKFQQLIRITIPLVFGYVVINMIIGFKNFLNSYDIIKGLTEGGPGTSTRSIAMTIVTGFTSGDYAYQMANATIFFVIVILISLLQLSLMRGRNSI